MSKDLAEITSPDFEGERLIVCRNPVLAAERRRQREDLLAATEKDLARIQAARARARGYRNSTTFATMISLIAAPLGDLLQFLERRRTQTLQANRRVDSVDGASHDRRRLILPQSARRTSTDFGFRSRTGSDIVLPCSY